MSGDIYSVTFFKHMCFAKADLDENGKLEGEKEQSIYNEYMKNFEKDGKKGLSNADVSLFKKSLEGTEPKGFYLSNFEKMNIENIEDYEYHAYCTLGYFAKTHRFDDFYNYIDSYKKNFMNESK